MSGPHDAHRDLTGADIDIIRLVARGLSNPEIAAQLGFQEEGLKTRLKQIHRHLGTDVSKSVLARVHLTAWAYENGLMGAEKPGRTVPDEASRQMVMLARMIVANRPLGTLRVYAEQLLRTVDAEARGGSGENA